MIIYSALLLFALQVPDRPQVVEQWIKSAERWVTRTGDAEAKKIIAYVKADYTTCIPGRLVFDCARPNARVQIMPLFAADQSLADTWKTLYESPEAALASGNRITIKADLQFSDSFQGLVMLHEAGHVYIPDSGGVADIDEEIQMRAMETRLLSTVNRVVWREMLEAEIKRIGNLITSGRAAIINPQYDVNLDKLLGPAKSDNEKYWRKAALFIYGILAFMDRAYPADTAKRFKRDWLAQNRPR